MLPTQGLNERLARLVLRGSPGKSSIALGPTHILLRSDDEAVAGSLQAPPLPRPAVPAALPQIRFAALSLLALLAAVPALANGGAGGGGPAGGTTISEGALSISQDASLGALAGGVSISSSAAYVPASGTGADTTLRTTATFASGRTISFFNTGGRIDTDAGTTLTLTGTLTGDTGASFVKQGAGTLVLTGDSSGTTAATGFLGATHVTGGTLRIAAGGKLGSASSGGGYVTNGATVVVTGPRSTWNTGSDLIVGGAGAGTLTIAGGGLVNVDSYAGTLQLGRAGGSGGTLNIGTAQGSAAAAVGELQADAVALATSDSRIVFNHTDVYYDLSPWISGVGSVVQVAGTTRLVGDSNYSGVTQVLGGMLASGNDTGFSASSD